MRGSGDFSKGAFVGSLNGAEVHGIIKLVAACGMVMEGAGGGPSPDQGGRDQRSDSRRWGAKSFSDDGGRIDRWIDMRAPATARSNPFVVTTLQGRPAARIVVDVVSPAEACRKHPISEPSPACSPAQTLRASPS